jgi:hypothetical protein
MSDREMVKFEADVDRLAAQPGEVGKLVNRVLGEDAQALKKVIAVEFEIKQDAASGKLSNGSTHYKGYILDLG